MWSNKFSHPNRGEVINSRERIMWDCLTLLTYGSLGEPKKSHQSEWLPRIRDFVWRVPDCTELSGGQSQEMIWLDLGTQVYCRDTWGHKS